MARDGYEARAEALAGGAACASGAHRGARCELSQPRLRVAAGEQPIDKAAGKARGEKDRHILAACDGLGVGVPRANEQRNDGERRSPCST